MKVRIKFSKQGCMKFIGHLDVMRYFQKAMRRADVDICYSEGYSPHQKMSFAAPLGVGLTSTGEYFDIEVNSTNTTSEMLKTLNDVMVEGISVLEYKLLPENAKNGMSIVAAADYNVYLKDNYKKSDFEDIFCDTTIKGFLEQKTITVLKKTKKGENTVDIKPMIYDMHLQNEHIFMKLAQGSVNNLKPELVIRAVYDYLNKCMPKYSLQYERAEIYAYNDKTEELITLGNMGDDIEQKINC
ncbi:MAG: TIGR03936 family radical SAM-associated protein [Eubacterium sp.]